MGKALLFLVDRQGRALAPELRAVLDSAYRSAAHDYPNLDDSLLATWAEQIGASMAEKEQTIDSPRRYAFAALQTKIREHFRSSGSREVLLGIHEELDSKAGGELQSVRRMERQVLFRELRNQLSERDRRIFILLEQDVTSPQEIASALGVGYNAAAKAVQRFRERVNAILTRRPVPVAEEDYDEHD